MGQISNQETTEPSFLWVFILMKDSKLLQVQASRRILSFWHTRFIFVRNNLILRVSAVKVVILFQKIELHILIYKKIYYMELSPHLDALALKYGKQILIKL